MSLRFFIDQCVPKEVGDKLREAGFTVLLLNQNLPADSADPVVLQKCQDLDAVLVSLNGDFSDIVTYPPFRFKGILSLQLHNHPEILPQLMSFLLNYLRKNTAQTHYHGKLFLVEAHRIRVRS